VVKKGVQIYFKVTDFLGTLCPLVTRFVVGLIFLQSGIGKLNHLDGVIGFFTSLHIPFPQIQAPFVAGVETAGGALLLLGLGTRFISLPLIGVMFVALITAKKDDITDLNSLFSTSEFLYIVLLVWLMAKGSGSISIDRIIKGRLKGQR
jgi:putative oxidoreductase